MNYSAKITLLTPVHIGAGAVLLRGYDFKTMGRQTWVLNQDNILAGEFTRSGDSGLDWTRLSKLPGDLVQDAELHEGSPFVRYSLAGSTTVDQVREQIKDVHGRCYLPGTSIKGALRTALMAYAVRSGAYTPDMSKLGDRREWAGQQWERGLFGPDPNRDLLRALQVSDTDPVDLQPSPLELVNAQVFATGEPGSPIVIEALKPDTVFHTTIKVDEYLVTEVAGQLGYGAKGGWLEKLPEIVGGVSRAFAREEMAWYRQRNGFGVALSTYQTLTKASLPENAFFLQVGWGGGWRAKSVVSWLPGKQQDQVRQKYQLGKPPRASREWKPNLALPFPKSRRLRAKCGQRESVAPDLPLGWVLVELEELP